MPCVLARIGLRLDVVWFSNLLVICTLLQTCEHVLRSAVKHDRADGDPVTVELHIAVVVYFVLEQHNNINNTQMCSYASR